MSGSGPPTRDGVALRFAAQLGRFGLVGIANTLVDFACTNLLFLMWRPSTPLELTLVAVAAGAVATAQSYLLNSRWTFRDSSAGRGAQLRFLAFALLGLATQAAVALFVGHRWVQAGHPLSLAMMNLAKVAAVVAAAGVTFVGYRIAVFTPDSVREFRDVHVLSGTRARPRWTDLLALAAIALAVRLAFVAAAPVAYGDAINYSWVAWLVGHGRAGEADAFWHSAFDYWQALLVPLGLDQFRTLVAASLLPGVLLVVPGYLVALRLYGRPAAVIAGLGLALHPRLVEYSVNGYAETFFLTAALWSVWGLTVLVREPRCTRAAVVAGAGLGAWFLVRNEAVVAAGWLALVTAVAAWRSGARPSSSVVTGGLLAALAMVAAYAAADTQLFGSIRLFSKGSNLSREHVEMLDPREAAREAYSTIAPASNAGKVGPVAVAARLAERWPRNVVYTLERLPGVLLSPLFLLAVLLPAFSRRRASVAGEEWPLLAFTVWPLLFYPLLQLEPRMLLPVAIGTCIFGAGALVALGDYLAQRLARPALRWAPAAAVTIALVPVIAVLAKHTEAERGFHRDIGAWIAANVAPGELITGDGYGYVTASGFWAGRRTLPRAWTDDPARLSAWVRARAPGVVILYERYLRESNPELLGALDHGLPGLVPRRTFDAGRAGRVMIWSIGAETQARAGRPAGH
ncbi:MAG: GtrA family protein [Steroidobacteraceae bacterium]